MAELKVHARPCDIERMVQNEEVRQEFSRRLKTAVARAGHAEWGVGARLSEVTGATAKAASKWLNAESMPGRANMLAIAEWLGVRVEWLQYGEGEPHQPATSPELAHHGQAEKPTGTSEFSLNMSALLKLKGKATPRSLAAIQRIEQAARQGRLKEEDVLLLEGIAARFEELNTKQP